jgi:hypothetical protein
MVVHLKLRIAGMRRGTRKGSVCDVVRTFVTAHQVVSGLRPFADRAVERDSSPNDNHGERLRFISTMDMPGLELNLPAMHCDEVQTWIPREWVDA